MNIITHQINITPLHISLYLQYLALSFLTCSWITLKFLFNSHHLTTSYGFHVQTSWVHLFFGWGFLRSQSHRLGLVWSAWSNRQGFSWGFQQFWLLLRMLCLSFIGFFSIGKLSPVFISQFYHFFSFFLFAKVPHWWSEDGFYAIWQRGNYRLWILHQEAAIIQKDTSLQT